MYNLAVVHIYQATCYKLHCFSITIWFMLANNSLMWGFYNPQFTNEAPGIQRVWVFSQGHTAGNQQRQDSKTGHWTPNPKCLTTLRTASDLSHHGEQQACGGLLVRFLNITFSRSIIYIQKRCSLSKLCTTVNFHKWPYPINQERDQGTAEFPHLLPLSRLSTSKSCLFFW